MTFSENDCYVTVTIGDLHIRFYVSEEALTNSSVGPVKLLGYRTLNAINELRSNLDLEQIDE